MLAYCGLAGALKISLVFSAFLVGHNRFGSRLPLSETGEHVCTGALHPILLFDFAKLHSAT
jgi:hypothetical protein